MYKEQHVRLNKIIFSVRSENKLMCHKVLIVNLSYIIDFTSYQVYTHTLTHRSFACGRYEVVIEMIE